MSIQSASLSGRLRSELTSDSETRRALRRLRRSLAIRSAKSPMLRTPRSQPITSVTVNAMEIDLAGIQVGKNDHYAEDQQQQDYQSGFF
jgi:hypothetical protein